MRNRGQIPCLLLACSLGLAACNDFLDINEPVADNLLLDSGAPGSVADAAAPRATTRDDEDAGSIPARSTPDAGPPRGDKDAAVTSPAAVEDTHWASWPMPNGKLTGLANTQSYKLSSNDLVVDQVTHLQWQDPVDDRAFTWTDATDYCAALTIPGGAFRVPTRIELFSLLDVTTSSPAIDNDAFPDTPADYFWTASKFVGDHASAWVVNFGLGPGLGFVSSSDLVSKHRVRCVR